MDNNPVTSVQDIVREFIWESFPSARTRQISDEESLLDNGLIDSMGTLDVVMFLETRFDMAVADDDLIPEHFESVNAIAEFVIGRTGLESQAPLAN